MTKRQILAPISALLKSLDWCYHLIAQILGHCIGFAMGSFNEDSMERMTDYFESPSIPDSFDPGDVDPLNFPNPDIIGPTQMW